MFDTSQKSTGTGYTTTVAFLVVAFIFSPAFLLFSRPVGFTSVALAITCSLLCLGLAWINWKKSSQLSSPSIVSQEEKSK